MQFTIYHTNDIHSHIEEFTKIASYLKQQDRDTSLCFDAGDFHDFLHVGMMGTQGRMGKYLLEEAGYDALAIGNNEGFAGDTILEVLGTCGKTHLLSCNLSKKDGSDISGVEKSIVIEKQGIRFLVIGVSPFSESYNVFYLMENLTGKDIVSSIQEEVDKQRGNYDICILISHLGLQDDKHIAKVIPQIDIIIGGHSHDDMEEVEHIGNTWIHQSGAYGKKLGIMQLTIEHGKIMDCYGQNLDTDEWSEDVLCKEIIKEQTILAKAYLSKSFYTLSKTLWYDPVIENPLTNFICDALCKEYACDFALMNSGIVSFGLQGEISKMKLLQCSPSHLNPTHVCMKGHQIRSAMQMSLDVKHCLEAGKGAGFRGYLVGRLHVSKNVQVIVKEDVMEILLDGKPLLDDQDYHVITSDYLQRGSGYPQLASEQQVAYEQGFIRDVLARHISDEVLQQSAFQSRFTYL